MKRFLIASLVVLCLTVAGTSALAAAPAGTHQDPERTAMFFVYWLGGWDEVKDGVLVPDIMGGEDPSYDAVPCGYDVMVDTLWIGQGYGQVKGIPDVDRLRLSITDKDDKPVVDQTWAQGRAAWTPVFAWDAYWVGLFGEVPPFNPNMGITTYGIKWEPTFTQAQLGGPGTYHVTVTEDLTHVVNDLTLYDATWQRPTKLLPGMATYTFDIELQECPAP